MRYKFAINFICFLLCVLSWLGIYWLWQTPIDLTAADKTVASIPTVVHKTIPLTVSKPAPVVVTKPTSVASSTPAVPKPDNNLTKQSLPLPAEINLAVPFTSQAPERNWSQPWQDACEEAAVLMIDAYIKNYRLSPLFAKDEMNKMVAWETKQGWGWSIDLDQIKQLFTYYSDFKKFRVVEDPTVEDIKRLLVAGDPVFVPAYGRGLHNPHFTDGGPNYHTLVIRGYTKDGFITNDPGTRFGENYVYKFDVLMNALHDWNGGDVKNGRKAVLVVE